MRLAVVVLVLVALGAYMAMPVAETAKAELDLSRSRDDGQRPLCRRDRAGKFPEIKQGELHSWIAAR